MSTQVLPKEAKYEAAMKLLEIKKSLHKNLKAEYSFLIENIDQIINHMNACDNSVLLQRFKTFNKKYDIRHNTSLSQSIPTLHRHLMNHYLMRAEQVT